jgi:hypothetical protein
MVVGLTKFSATEMHGISSGKPPACRTPRLTSSTRFLKCEWQLPMSLQVLRMAMMGLPSQSAWS